MHPTPCPKAAGFTLLELMVVTAVMSVLAGIAVPSLLSHRAVTNERAAIATLRAITNAQMQFKTAGNLDANADGSPEFGTLPELAGVAPLRSGGAPVTPAHLSSSLGTLDGAGFLLRAGYHFALYLPDSAGVALATTAGNMAAIDANLARDFWTCVAWPAHRGTTGVASYFVSQQGEILVCRDGPYSGLLNVPPAGAAYLGGAPNTIHRNQLAQGAIGADGQFWAPVQ